MKAVIPAAGLGTGLLPSTKAIPKALWPIKSKPAIQWVLEEAASAEFTECVIVLSPMTELVREYLKPLPASDARKRHPSMTTLEQMLEKLRIQYVCQEQPLGLGHALLQARSVIGESAFALMLPDNVWTKGSGPMTWLYEVYVRHKVACIALQNRCRPTASDAVYRGVPISDGVVKVLSLERGATDASAPEIYCGIGRAIMLSEALDYLEQAWSSKYTDFDESAALLGLMAGKGLLGVVVDPPQYHLGSTERC